MDEDWFRRFIAQARWVFARTMPESPHWYTLRRENDPVEFERAVIGIRTHGYVRHYKGHDYVSYDLDGWYYWTMGAPVEETILINRAQFGGDSALLGEGAPPSMEAPR